MPVAKRARASSVSGGGARGRSRSRGRQFVPRGPKTAVPTSNMVTLRKKYYGIISRTVNNATANVVTLNDLPNFAEFTALFDAYKINRLTWHFYPSQGTVSEIDGGITHTGGIALLTTAIDYNDKTAPTTNNELLEYGSCKTLCMNVPRTISYVPRIQLGATDSVTGTVPALESGPRWLSTDQPKIEHYGLKWFLESNTSGNVQVNCYLTAEVEFKMTK